ncbi:RDD family protein [Streptomyces albus]|uniref:RDD family protein n=1 Tax=Streptomyces albus TaxID=1888 RepID=UPI0036F7190A
MAGAGGFRCAVGRYGVQRWPAARAGEAQQLGGDTPSDHAQATGTAVPPPGPTPPAGQYESGIVLAGRARRLAARVLDMVVWAVVSAPVTGLVTNVTQEGDTRAVAGMGAAALVWLVLHPLALSRFGSTLGKAALGVRSPGCGTAPGPDSSRPCRGSAAVCS